MTERDAARIVEKTAPERMALLYALAFTAQRLCVAQFEGFTARLVDALARSAQSADKQQAELYRHASQHLNAHRLTFHRLASDSLQQALLQAVQDAAKQGEARPNAARPESGTTDLLQIDFAAMERDAQIDRLSHALNADDLDALAALSLRIANWLQSEEGNIAQNPFRSEVVLKAIVDAWQKFDMNSASRRLVLQQMQPEIFLQLGPVWRALNRELATRGVLPDAEERCRRQNAEAARLRPLSLRERMRRWLAPDGELNLARADELLGKIFEQISQDEAIPPSGRALLARLQEPVRTMALADIPFFFSDRHPARRLVASAIDCALGVEESAECVDPLCQALEQAIGRVQQDNMAQVADDIDNFMKQQAQERQAALCEAIAAAAAQEGAAHEQQLAEEDVTSRIETGEVAGFVETFLQEQWTRVLAFAYGVRGSRPDALPAVLKTMDDLIWSVKPKAGAEERKELLERLPALLALLNVWLNVVKWEGEERQSFFAALAERHAAAMRSPAELTPRNQLELRMTALQKASEHHLSRRALEQQEEALVEFMQQVGTLVPGRWVEFVRNDSSKVNCQLAWVSPERSRLVFTGRQGKLVFTMEDKALAQGLRADRATIIAIEPLAAALRQLG